MQIMLDCRLLRPLMVAFLMLSTASVTAQPPGKGKDKGSEDPPPPPAPVNYELELITVEGLAGLFAVNDRHLAIAEANVADVTSQTIDSEAWISAVVVDVDTGAVSYVDNLLTEPTPWTVLPEGVYDATFTAVDINNTGDIVGVATYYLAPDRSLYEYEGFLLKRTGASYQPISFGRTELPWQINDMGDIAFRVPEYDQNGTYQRMAGAGFLPAGDTEIEFIADASYVFGMNAWGQILCSRGAFDEFVWNPDGTIYNLTDLRIADDINDWGVVSGQVEVVTEFKERGKIRTRTDRVPATWSETAGVILLEGGDFVSQGRTQYVMTNNQNINGQGAFAATDSSGDIWLKLPQQDGFYVGDAMTSSDFELFLTIRSDNSPIAFPTPLLADGAVAHDSFPILAGVGNGQLWVLRPVPSAP